MTDWREASLPRFLFPPRVFVCGVGRGGLSVRSGIVWAVSQEASSGGQVDIDGYSTKQQPWEPVCPGADSDSLLFCSCNPIRGRKEPLLALGAESFINKCPMSRSG